jgi:glutamate-1-semialdehyde 2,1-aminomutase
LDSKGGKAFDTWLGSGSLIFGHGQSYATELALDMLPDGSKIDETFFANLEAAAGWKVGGIGLQTSGSSAITRACRLARAATGKNKIAVIKSFWHGSDDQFLFAGSKRDAISAGVTHASQNNSYWFESIDQFLSEADLSDYAALLVEPYQGADPCITTLQANHSAWRNVLVKNNILLIADEIITGFRERFGSCTASRQCNPDILVFGKAIGNGYPVGMVLTTTAVANAAPEKFFWGGTFSASPTQLNVITAHLQRLKSLDYKIIENNLSALIGHIEKIINLHEFRLHIVRGCGFARIRDESDDATPRAFISGERSDYISLRNVGLKQGIYFGSNGLIFSSVNNIEGNL